MKTQLAPNEPSKKALAFYKEVEIPISNLFSRWLDESQYEDINDYQKPIDPIAKKHDVVIVKMNKRPFGCDFKVDGRTYKLKIATSGKYEYYRIDK